MGIALLKKLNARMPDSIKLLLAPLIRSKLIYDKAFQKQFSELTRMDSSTASEIERVQFTKLKETLMHAYEHTSYYHRVFEECGFNPYEFSDLKELHVIPELTRDSILENFDDLQADDISDFYSATTGGSTGTPLKVNLDRESIYKERAFIYHFWEKHGYSYKSSKVASFRGTDFDGMISKFNPLYAEIQMNPCTINEDTIQKYIQRMDAFGVKFLHGFPSAIYSFCKYAKQAGIKLMGKYHAVFFISENVYDFQRSMIKEVLGCDAFSFYGHTERAVFAEQMGGGYLFNPLYGYVETDENSNIICTGFLNRKMPLIRYHVDDCAEKYYDLFRIEGHRDGILYGRNGEIISAAMLEVHSPLLDKIANYQFIQQQPGEVNVHIVPFKDLSDVDRMAIQNVFQKKIGTSIDVTVCIVNQLDYTARGKFKLIIQKSKSE